MGLQELSEKSSRKSLVRIGSLIMEVRSRAPLRVSYAGGGTDVPPYPFQMGGVVLSCTIKNYAYCSILPRADGKVTVLQENQGARATSGSLEELKGDGEVEFVRGVASRFDLNSGFDASLRYDALPGTGLGSSSALCVSLIGAFRDWKGNSMTDYEIANLAYEVERKDVGIPGGTRRSGGILKRQIESYENRSPKVMSALEKMKDLTYQMKDLLLTGNLTEFARLLNQEWELKKVLDQAISNETTETLLKAARQAGALGGKLLGAGGGGFLLLYCESGKQVQVQNVVESLGGRTFPVRFDKDGLQTWRHPR